MKFTELTEDTAPTGDDLVAVVNDPAGTPGSKKVTLANLFFALQSWIFGADAGSTDTYVVTLSPAPAAYVTGQLYRFKANTANTGACTVNFNSLGAKTIKKAAGGITTDLADNDIRAGQWVDLVYDGTNFQIQSTLGNAVPAGTGDIRSDGTVPFAADQSMGSHKLTNVTDPSSAQDAATKAYVDSTVSAGTGPTGSAGGDLSGTFPNPTVTKINGTSLAGLATGILKNTTGTGVPSVVAAPSGAVVGDTDTQTLTNKTLTSPTLTTPALGTPASGNLSNCTVDGTDSVGFRNIPQNSKSAAYTTVLSDAGKHIYHPSSDNNARTFTIDSNANVAYPIGTSITFINEINTVTIAITSDTLTLMGTGSTGSRTLAANGIATAIKIASTKWVISGVGLT